MKTIKGGLKAKTEEFTSLESMSGGNYLHV